MHYEVPQQDYGSHRSKSTRIGVTAALDMPKIASAALNQS
jgi:hypothetical protein